MKLLQLYCCYHPNFMDRLSRFPKNVENRFIKKLNNEKDRSNFRSTISEIRFGEFFMSLDIECEYDKKFQNQIPDWTLNQSSAPVICEVYRMGKSNVDQVISDFESLLIEKIGEIKSNHALKINFKKEDFDYEESIVEDIKQKVENWILEINPKINEEIWIGNFNFKVISILSNSKKVACISNAMLIDYKIEKLKQNQKLSPNEITKKMHKYTELIKDNKIPFFICVDIDFESGFNHDEFEEYFLGRGASFYDYDPSNPIITDIGQLGEEWTILGEFYNNIQISGVITCVNNTYKVLLNPIKAQEIYKDKYEAFLQKLNYGR